MTTTYKPRPIDSMLRIIEREADNKGHIIEENEMYMFICTKITDLEFGDKVEWEDMEKCSEYLRNLFAGYGLNYDYHLRKITEANK